MTDELEWRPVVGFPDYEISEDGVVKRVSARKRQDFVGRVISQHIKTGGYLYVGIRDQSGRPFWKGVHRLLAESFIGPPPDENSEAAHRDGNPANNVRSNIRWLPPKANQADRWRHGTMPHGDNHQWSVLTEAQVRLILKDSVLHQRGGVKSLAKKFNVHPATISAIKRGLNWKWIK